MSNSSRPHGLQPTRLLHPWDFPGKSTGVVCHCWIDINNYFYLYFPMGIIMGFYHLNKTLMKFKSLDRISFMKINQDLRKSLVLKLCSITFLTSICPWLHWCRLCFKCYCLLHEGHSFWYGLMVDSSDQQLNSNLVKVFLF